MIYLRDVMMAYQLCVLMVCAFVAFVAPSDGIRMLSNLIMAWGWYLMMVCSSYVPVVYCMMVSDGMS